MGRRQAVEQAFGQVIRQLRTDAEMTQEALAHACNIHVTYLSRLERGLQIPTLTTVCRLAKALKQRPHALIKAAEGDEP